MPPRLNKRQIREQQELEALAVPKNVEENGEIGDEQVPSWSRSTKPIASAFAALGPDDHGEEEESDASEPSQARESSKKKKKKKKKTVVSAEGSNTPQTATPPPKQASSKSQKQKKVAKQKAQEDEGDDIDRALAELSLKYPGTSADPAARVSTRATNVLSTLLSVNPANLDSEAEMRKFFGAKVVSASKAASSTPSSRRRPVTSRSTLTNPQPTWWPATLRQGLSLRSLADHELLERRSRHAFQSDLPGEKHWTVEYSKKYKGVTKSFIQMVMSGDPEGFSHLLRAFPYHADTLLQLSEVYSHREEHSSAADFIDRALFTYERAFVGAFNFTMGINRLDFDHVENRPFFLGLHRQVADLQRRGCVRTAFEYAKLLLSLDPSSDPHGSLFHLDFLAIKTNQFQWLLDVWNSYGEMGRTVTLNRINVQVLPGWAFARALALYNVESNKHDIEHEQSTAALSEAIHNFPSVVPLLAEKADISLPNDIRTCAAFKIHTSATTLSSEVDTVLHLLSHLYVHRSHPLWKAKNAAKWFADTVSQVVSSPKFKRNSAASPTPEFRASFSSPSRLTYSVYRHVLVLESNHRSLFAFFPSSVMSARQLACDPLPPLTRVTEYNSEFFAGAEDPFAHTSRSRKQNERLLERMIPDPAFRRQLQGFFEAHPNFAQRFPGGIVQFAQIAGQLGEDALEDLFAAELAAEPPLQGQGAQMPGALFGLGDDVDDGGVPDLAENVDEEDEEDGEDDDDDEEEIDEGVAPLPVRIWRNVLGRFWGGGDAPPAEDQPH
ncbi:transcriptional repressor TCF25-domain-containing protein [Cristinia sonorae]|uniref:Transcriptional repressor TCF25-domain-containing protein n=1 Tax=Cristinia sonorae TaxID=1940300 RepID=A0A8K0XU05_9AGAR|nr:transcriptional repressor TCF25-domain-containing protein [Cristinia sonorae]